MAKWGDGEHNPGMTQAGVLRALVTVVIVVAVVLGAVWIFQRKLIYLPDSSPVPPAAAVLPGAQDVRLRTTDGLDLGAWLVPATTPGPMTAVLVANGNGGNRLGRAPLAAALARSGLTVLLFDYRGYGGNPGSPTEDGLALDVRAAYGFLTQEQKLAPERIIFYGESLGSAVVTELAVDHPPAGLLLRSPFVDLAAAGSNLYPFLPVRLLLRDRFPVKENLARVQVPTVVVYGSADSIIPAAQSRDVATANSARQVEITGADHNDLVLLDGARLVDAVRSLIPR
jgi:pimeloyl-ACP methyl ester carboxylesterase